MGIGEIIGRGSMLVVCAALGLTLAGCGGTASNTGSAPAKAVAAKTVKKSNKKSGSRTKETKAEGSEDNKKATDEKKSESVESKTEKKAETKKAAEKQTSEKKSEGKKSGGSSKPAGSGSSSSKGDSKPSSGSGNSGSGSTGSGSNQGGSSDNGNQKPQEPERVWAVVTPAWDEQVYHPAVTHTETQKQKVGVQYRATDGTLFDNEDACADYCAENSLWYSCLPKYEDVTVTVVDQEAYTETIHHDAVYGWVNK